MKKYNYIYITTNNINGKYYIGVHSTDNLEDGYLGSGKIIKRAVKKYGKENFNFKIIQFYETRLIANEWEEYIVDSEFINFSDTYNIYTGGGGCSSEDIIGVKNPFYGKKHTDEVKKKISETHKGKALTQSQKDEISIHFKNLVRTKIHCENISKSLKGKAKTKEHKLKNSESQQRPVFHKETGIFYKSLKEYSEIMDIKYSRIKDKSGKYRRQFKFI